MASVYSRDMVGLREKGGCERQKQGRAAGAGAAHVASGGRMERLAPAALAGRRSRGGLGVSSAVAARVTRTRAPRRAAIDPAGVTRDGTACRSGYRPSRRRSRCDAYSPPNYYYRTPSH